MNEEEKDRSFGPYFKLIIGIIIGLVVGYFVGAKGFIRLEKDAEVTADEVAVLQEEPDEETVDDLVEEHAVEPTDEPVAEPVSSSVTSSNPSVAKDNSENETNAITLVSYSQSWLDDEAHISIKNNTDNVITSVIGRIVYYDMSGNMLDYQDFKKEIKIDPGMSKKFDLPGYGNDEYYAYYKSEINYFHPNNKYKIDFQIKSYTIK